MGSYRTLQSRQSHQLRPSYRQRIGYRLRAYGELGRLQFHTILAYRVDFVFNVVVLLLEIFLLRVVWTSVYADQATVQGSGGVGRIDLATQIAYSTLASVQFWLFNPWANQLARRVSEGRIATDLARPVGIVAQTVSGQVGATVALLPFAILALPFAVLVGGAAAPAGPIALLGYVLATVLAYVTTVLLNTLVGMIAFWTVEVSGAVWIHRLIAQVFSGALVPLWFMPDWLRGLAEVLPFQATTYTPVAIYLGKLAGSDLLPALGIQASWVVVLSLAVRLVWARALRRVVVQGG